jgi:rRNA biogenesis protein RRP5
MALQRLQLRANKRVEAQGTLTRSLQSLSKHKHVETISRFALSEFDFGSHDKARQLFEELVETYPKRTDIWHLYVDREVKLGNLQQARQLFERMINSKATTRNMKTVFKKYLALEVRFGDEESQQSVKDKAAAYVNSLA